jgi:CheY-like chemotaxis protein
MFQGINVIAVDDDQLSLDMLVTILGIQGANCITATNGVETLEALTASPDTDILLMDLQMPEMDGFEVLSRCKNDPDLRDIPIIVMTATPRDKIKALELGADDFISKPYNLEELKLRIAKQLRSRRLAQQLRQENRDYFSNASHKVRTPIHQILGLAELLQNEQLTAGQQEMVSLLTDSVDNLHTIIMDILSHIRDDGT